MTPKRRLPLFVLVAVIGVLMASTPNAVSRENETFGVTPYPEEADGVDRGAFRIPLETGETFEDAIRIYNRTVQEVALTVYAADAEAGSGETDISPVTVGFRNDEPTGLGSWIDLAREDIELAPRDEVIISFRVQVKSADPRPANGAIVVETRGTGTGGARREFLNVLSVPGGTETTSERIRPLLLRSPWIVVAMLGLVVAIALVWIGARRARRPKDVLVPAGEIDQPEIEDGIPEASRPVIKRLGAKEAERTPEPLPVATKTLERPRRPSREDGPLLEDAFLVEVDDDDDDDEPPQVSDDTDGDIGDDITFIDPIDMDDEEDDEDDLPPARRRAPSSAKRSASSSSKRSTTAKTRSSAKKKPVRPAAKKPSPKRRRSPAKKTTAKAKPKPSPKPRTTKRPHAPSYIPLDDL